MRRGTTPTHNFTLPFNTDVIKSCRVVYSQDGNVKLVKETEDVTLNENIITLTLTQEETFAFECTKYVDIQVRVLTLDGESLASEITRVPVLKCLDEEVLV